MMIISREKYENLSNLVDAQRELIDALKRQVTVLEKYNQAIKEQNQVLKDALLGKKEIDDE